MIGDTKRWAKRFQLHAPIITWNIALGVIPTNVSSIRVCTLDYVLSEPFVIEA